jgi:hypothetical protein
VYTYAAVKLWIAYGLEIFFTLLIMLIGIGYFLANGASYNSNLSSIVRSAGNAILSTEIEERHMNAKDPLPSYLSGATIVIRPEPDGKVTSVAKEGPRDLYAMDAASAGRRLPGPRASTEELLEARR